ncbi:MAG: 2-oxo-4-hydroxy-4-carboxy-5-ureidoimidazoline decarboxylase [Candidatus Dormibacteraeota bacterium]|nr:2-oxo-4-hydroxy-4-carboxy-5-ureidoimidazoline decarboxylase [Candidatus Dormibacteraeota bacterium]
MSPSEEGPPAWFNGLPAAQAEAELLACCGSRAWAHRVTEGRPYAGRDDVLRASERAWGELGPADWLEAMAAHPRIGEPRIANEATWSAQEQSVAAAAAPAVRDSLTLANRDYEARFGHVFLICATGLTAEAILGALRSRMENDAATELQVASEELHKITDLRLIKLLAS